MKKVIQKIMNIFLDKDFDNHTTESKILEKIDNILKDGSIDNIKTKDDFIRFLFKIYFYKNTYRPFVSYLEIIFRYFLIILLIILIGISFIEGLENFFIQIRNYDFKSLWYLLSNFTYVIFILYIIIRIFNYVRKLLRNEIKKNFLSIFGVGFIKICLFIALVFFTWFLGQFLASLINISYISIIELGIIEKNVWLKVGVFGIM